jgi:hypothetical protein
MEGISGLFKCGVVVTLAAALGGCIRSDYERRGIVDGRYWCERVADDPTQPYIDELRSELLALGPDVSEEEATVLAEVSVRHAEYIRRKWGMVRPIELHNTLVNLGLRPRGLCYQCAEAMYERLHALDLKTFDLHWGVAHKGDLWLEHSGVIVTAKGRPFEDGVVVDAWRHSGRLRWARVTGDRYPWVEMIKWKYPDTARLAGETAVARREAGAPERGGQDAVPAGARVRETGGREAGSGDADGVSPGAPEERPVQRVDSRTGSRADAGRASSAGPAPTVAMPPPTPAPPGKQLSAIVTTRPNRQ